MSNINIHAEGWTIGIQSVDFGVNSEIPVEIRTCSKYTVNTTGLQLSLCGVPTLRENGFDVEVPLIRVPLRRNCINLCSSP